MTAPIHSGEQALAQLKTDLLALKPTEIIVLFDDNTAKNCARHLAPFLPKHRHIKISPGEAAKHLETCMSVWEKLLEMGADRRSVLINLGGGVVGDLGGFVAGCYKRGIRYMQVPTTLLSMVDASVGNKTGVDFQGGKNLIGLFNPPEGVYIWPQFLETLPEREVRSGFAEVIKHWLIADGDSWQTYSAQATLPVTEWTTIIPDSVEVKRRIVAEDPLERGIRKALNFGHTIGHAVESCVLSGPSVEGAEPAILHGEAVAIGMICECWLSEQRGKLTAEEFQSIRTYIEGVYPDLRELVAGKVEEAEFIKWLKADKKNEGGKVLCSLLNGIGGVEVNVELSIEEAVGSFETWLRG